jgi:hypothetical protein
MFVFGLFLIVVAYLVTASLARRSLPTFMPSPIAPRALGTDTVRSDTFTVDARDPAVWQFYDFDRRSVVFSPDTAGWDLAFRRIHIIAGDAIADLGIPSFDSVEKAPADGYVTNRLASDTINLAISKWYDYSFLSHLLEPKERTYVVKTREGRFAKFVILSYYCTGFSAGCFTVRYAYPLQATDSG